MLLVFLDTEMSGLDPEKHRAVEIAYQIIDSVTGRRLLKYESIIKQPRDVWLMADPESLKITGFTWEKNLRGKPEEVVAAEITNDFNRIGIQKENSVFICQNPSLDRIFFSQLISAAKQNEYGWPYHWLDLASMYWTIRLKENKKSPQEIKQLGLSKDQIARYYGLPSESTPHRAMQGVNHLIACYEAIFGKIGSGNSAVV